MVTNLCFGLTFLLVPLLIELFNLQAALRLSDTGHAAAEILILGGIFWLLMQILRLDEHLYLQALRQQEHKPEAAVQNIQKEIYPAPITQTGININGQPKDHALRRARLLLENIMKNRRTIKPL